MPSLANGTGSYEAFAGEPNAVSERHGHIPAQEKGTMKGLNGKGEWRKK
jgi:hypothetical protein